jgi:CheY-like chemotaxis protein
MISRTRNILIADDDELMRWQLGRIVKSCGGEIAFSAESVEDVEENASLDFTSIDTAIVDYEFRTEKTGIDLIRYLKERGVERVFLCTGYYEDERVRSEASMAGADLVIAKPIDEKHVRGIIRHEAD